MDKVLSPRITVDNLRIDYGQVTAVDDVSLAIEPGQFVSLLGPSGSGKTTILKTVAGFVEPVSGVVTVEGRNINDAPPRFRNFGMVFQNYALFPHMTVEKNVSYGLRARRMSRADISQAVNEILEIVGLERYANRYPAQLSGGQQQRVALARAIVIRPQLLLMDEPLAALDLKLRQQLQLDIRRIQEQLGISTLYVTHDQEEALTLSDKVIVMSEGRISSEGNPSDIYHKPNTRFTATFVGNKTILEAGDSRELSRGIAGLPGQLGTIDFDGSGHEGGTVYIILQPEDIECSPEPFEGAIAGTVTGRRFLGKSGLVTVSAASDTFQVNDRGQDVQQGKQIYLAWRSENAHIVCENI